MANKDVKVKSYRRKDGTRVKASKRQINASDLKALNELTRPRTTGEVIQDTLADITTLMVPIKNKSGQFDLLSVVPHTELRNKRYAVKGANRTSKALSRISQKGLYNATIDATENYKLDPNSKKAIKNINTLKNRSRIAGMSEKKFKKKVEHYENLMKRGGFQNARITGTDFSRIESVNSLDFKRGRDKKKRKQKLKKIGIALAGTALLATGIKNRKSIAGIPKATRKLVAETKNRYNKKITKLNKNAEWGSPEKPYIYDS